MEFLLQNFEIVILFLGIIIVAEVIIGLFLLFYQKRKVIYKKRFKQEASKNRGNRSDLEEVKTIDRSSLVDDDLDLIFIDLDSDDSDDDSFKFM